MKHIIFLFLLQIFLYAATHPQVYPFLEPIAVEEAPIEKIEPIVIVDMDIDKDGVLNENDKCPNTKKNTFVNSYGCKVSTIALLLENDKNSNAIVVSTNAGESLIEKPNQFVTLSSKNNPPTAPKEMSQDIMTSLFGEVLSMSPVKSQHFVLYFQGKKLLIASKVTLSDAIESMKERERMFI